MRPVAAPLPFPAQKAESRSRYCDRLRSALPPAPRPPARLAPPTTSPPEHRPPLLQAPRWSQAPAMVTGVSCPGLGPGARVGPPGGHGPPLQLPPRLPARGLSRVAPAPAGGLVRPAPSCPPREKAPPHFFRGALVLPPRCVPLTRRKAPFLRVARASAGTVLTSRPGVHAAPAPGSGARRNCHDRARRAGGALAGVGRPIVCAAIDTKTGEVTGVGYHRTTAPPASTGEVSRRVHPRNPALSPRRVSSLRWRAPVPQLWQPCGPHKRWNSATRCCGSRPTACGRFPTSVRERLPSHATSRSRWP